MPSPNILSTKELNCLKIKTYKSVYSNKTQIGSKVDTSIGNHIYNVTNVQHFILLKRK